MSLFERPARAASVALMLAVVSACGFQPMYGNAPSRVSEEKLDGIRIPYLAEREGQLLRNALSRNFNPDGRSGNHLYDLDIHLTKNVSNLGVRQDATATRANLTLQANFFLRAVGQKKPVYSGSAVTTVSYNILDERFATVVAEQNATERAARTVADQLKLRISAFLARQSANAGR